MGLPAGSRGPSVTWRVPTEHLLELLRDGVEAVDPLASAALRERIEECRVAVVGADSPEIVLGLLDQCIEACRKAMAGIDGQRTAQKRETAALVTLVREARAIVAGDAQTFTTHVEHSVERFELLVRVDDLARLKAELATEVYSLRRVAAERQQSWERTFDDFNRRVEILEQQLAITRHEATLDPLTQVANRSVFDAAGRGWLTGTRRQFVMALVDMDSLKAINDAHGHAVGDRAVQTVAHALKSSVRSEVDVVARLGGDEFAVLAVDISLRQAEARINMVIATLGKIRLDTPSGTPLRLTLSCGMAELAAGDTLESLRERADTALYQAKRQGKNRVVTVVKPTVQELMRR